MKKMLLISCVMLAITASAAMAAASLNISWGPECASDALLTNKTFSCTVNTGSSMFVCSFVPGADKDQLLAVDAVIDGQSDVGTVIPNWWQFKNTGACRNLSLSVGQSFSANAVMCLDPWNGLGSPVVTYYGDPVLVAIPVPPVVGNRARMKVTNSIPAASSSPVTGGQEYNAFTCTVNNTRTVGTGACAGCLLHWVWVFNGISPGYMSFGGEITSEQISLPLVNQCITWQGAVAGLCSETPAQNTTWGQVKSLYR